MQRDLLTDKREWTMQRNCSLSPRQMAVAYVVLCLLSFSVATFFVLHGAWPVLVFSVLEMSAVTAAFLCHARHVADHEHIVLAQGCLTVETVLAGKMQQVQLEPYWTRVVMPRRGRDLIVLEARGVKVTVGGFVNEVRRAQFAEELRQELRGGLFG